MLAQPAPKVVHIIPLADLIRAFEENYRRMGKPIRVVASMTQVMAWCDGLPPIAGKISIMGVPIEVGPDEDCELQWVKKVLPK